MPDSDTNGDYWDTPAVQAAEREYQAALAAQAAAKAARKRAEAGDAEVADAWRKLQKLREQWRRQHPHDVPPWHHHAFDEDADPVPDRNPMGPRSDREGHPW